MLKMRKISLTYDMRVYTDTGEYFGDVEESILTRNKVFGWRVKSTKSSFLNKVLGSAKGVIVPHQLVKSIGDIMIISKSAVPSYPAGEEGDDTHTAPLIRDPSSRARGQHSPDPAFVGPPIAANNSAIQPHHGRQRSLRTQGDR